MSYERPFDLLGKCEGERVRVRLKNRSVLTADLVSFDKHINLALKDVEFPKNEHTTGIKELFLRGDRVVGIEPEGELE